MGFWIEVRCDVHVHRDCLSVRNNGPMGMALATKAGIKHTTDALSRMAIRDGWVKTRDGWTCPACAPNMTPNV